MYKKILDKINSYTTEKYDVSVYQPPVTNIEIQSFKNKCQSELKYVPIDQYIDFLKLSNGYDWNGLQIYGIERMPNTPIEGFIEANQDFAEENETVEYVVFASSGVEKYVFNLTSKKYLVIDSFSLDVFEEVDGFDELITEALKNNS